MSHYLSKLAFEFESHIVSPEDHLDEDLPAEIRKYIDLYLDAKSTGDWMNSEYIREYGGPTAIAKHPEHGWALVGAGQGPFIMWSEKEL